ncbi:hypothetical protein CCB80_05255 [Armatimonadetes bacterium Uphvl-Ar1]|nr:hypothetical protein CCB80_05255 [Armatimonadetes bacterium Uphvl-Ar1]
MERKPQNEARNGNDSVDGNPSVNRQAFGTVGMMTDQAAVSEKSLAEFGDVLNAALSGGQEKEVNLDELIAQLVGLDLLPGMKPNHGMEGGTPQFDLSWGRIDAVARGALSEAASGLTAKLGVTELSVGNLESEQVISGLANWLSSRIKPASIDVAAQDVTPVISDAEPGQSSGPSGDVAGFLTGNSNATNGDRNGNGTNGDRSGQYRLEPGLRYEPNADITPEANPATDAVGGPKIGYQGTGQGRREDGLGTGLISLAELKKIAQATGPMIRLEEVKEKLVSLLESGRVVDPAMVQRLQAAINLIDQDLSKPENAQEIAPLTLAKSGSQSSERIRSTDGLVPLELTEGKVLDADSTGLSKGEPAKSNPTQRAEAEPIVLAQDIIEGSTGRLTRESVATQPTAVQAVVGFTGAKESKKIGEKPVAMSMDSMESGGEAANELKVDGQQKNLTKTQEPAEKLIPTVAMSALAKGVSEPILITYDDVTGEESVSQLDGSGEVSREDFGMKVDSGVADEIAVKPETKADTAVNQARQKLIETTLDLIAARRPQSVSIQLTPQDMGTIEVNVRSLMGRVDVDLLASDDGVRQSLATQRYDLIQSIETRGATVTSMNVGAQLGQATDQSGNQGQGQATQQEFRQAANLGQFSNGAEAPVTTTSSYAKVGSGRVDLAA